MSVPNSNFEGRFIIYVFCQVILSLSKS